MDDFLLGTDFPAKRSVVVSLGLSAPITGPRQSFQPRVARPDVVSPLPSLLSSDGAPSLDDGHSPYNDSI